METGGFLAEDSNAVLDDIKNEYKNSSRDQIGQTNYDIPPAEVFSKREKEILSLLSGGAFKQGNRRASLYKHRNCKMAP